MCGIHLIIDKTQTLSAEYIDLMASQTRYRGPDETDTGLVETQKQNYLFGVNRLKITDPTNAAAQPFFSEDKRKVLLFNGEIYNYYSLKNELIRKGIVFSTHSDTEVLLHWLTSFGSLGIKDLEGMFAFVFIDIDTDKIIIARDRYGIKPVYYYQDENYFIVSSEIKPILKTRLFPSRLNESQVDHYLQYKYAKFPETFFRNIMELSPGTMIQKVQGRLQIEKFTTEMSGQDFGSLQLSEIENLISDSLLQQISAPVPTGLLLSGGVDSTLLLALAQKEGYTLPTFSIVNSKAEGSFGTNDFKYAAKAAKLFGAEHHEMETDISILEKFDDFVHRLDQPIGDSSFLMTSEICRHASGTMKILLSGAGADEIFGGYNRHWAFYKYLKHRKTIGLLMPALSKFSKMLPDGNVHPLRKQLRLLRKLSNSYDISPVRTFHKFLVFNEFESKTISDTMPEFTDSNDLMNWALNHDLTNYLVGDVLALSDRASMWHGIELRVPYLDDKLVHHVKSLPTDFVMRNGRKWILKELLKKQGGKEFAQRPKEGFGLPLSHWLTDKRVSHLWEFVNKKDHIIFKFVDKNLLDKLLAQQKQKSHDHGPLLWSILVLAHWLQHNFE
jgi:asparagine synthase (glutamine-hydrolysing)